MLMPGRLTRSLCLTLGVFALSALSYGPVTPPAPNYSAEDKRAVADFWAMPGRYTISSAVTDGGPYQARQTPAGSVWLHGYFTKVRGAGKVNPKNDPAPSTEAQRRWDTWIDAKYAWDEYQAVMSARQKNVELGAKPGNISLVVPKKPDAMPSDLKKIVSAPPAFVSAVLPRKHTVDFGDHSLSLNDNPPVRRRYAYYRWADGVMDVGTPMRGTALDDLRPLFAKAGITETELRVMAAVSLLEGGFDSINTYDTGFVSVGFIQFASLSKGSGSLGRVLQTMKLETPESFESHFRRFGIDVTSTGQLVALHPDKLTEHVGADANTLIIKDKRLAAVFVRAGRLSEEFKIAQIRTAKGMYYPGDLPITITMGGRKVTGKVSDVIKTEAGMAILMDRKVNTGNLGDLESRLTTLAADFSFTSLEELCALEFQVCRAMVYRTDFLAEKDLQKPRDLGLVSSRKNPTGTRPPAARRKSRSRPSLPVALSLVGVESKRSWATGIFSIFSKY